MVSGVSIQQFLKDLNQKINDDNVYNGAAALGFYLTLAIFPAIILVMAITPYLPTDHMDKALMNLLGQALPTEVFDLVAGVVREVTSEHRGGLLSFGILGTIWAVSTGMYSIMRQLNVTHDVEEARSFVRGRATALVLSLLFIFLVIGAFSLVVFGGLIQAWFAARFDLSGALINFFAVFRWTVIVLALLLGFGIIYRYAPNVEKRFALVTPGSVCGLVVLIVASLGFATYTDNFANYSAAYGSIGAVIILMLWLYIVGLAILLGSEINVLLEHYRSKEGGSGR